MMRFLNTALFLSLFSLVSSSLSGSVSESYSEGCKRGPRGKTGHQGKQGFPGSGPKLDIPALTVAIDDFPIPSGDFPHPAGDFTFNIILITPDGREVGTPVFSSADLPEFPVFISLPGPLYTGTYLLVAEIVSVNIPGSLGIVATTFNTADTNLYGIQSGFSGISSLIGQRATLSAFAVP